MDARYGHGSPAVVLAMREVMHKEAVYFCRYAVLLAGAACHAWDVEQVSMDAGRVTCSAAGHARGVLAQGNHTPLQVCWAGCSLLFVNRCRHSCAWKKGEPGRLIDQLCRSQTIVRLCLDVYV